MRILNRALLLSLFLLPGLSSGAEILRLNRAVVGFEDHGAPGSMMLISQDGQTDWVTGLKAERKVAYKIEDQRCAPSSQSTVYTAQNGLTLAYPFLVGVGRACYIDERTKNIRLLLDYEASLPKDAYAAAYAGADEGSAYFLINGRPFPEGKEGYIWAVIIDKRSLSVRLRPLLNGVPGYSGAMLSEGGLVWVTAWEDGANSLYKLPLGKLHALIRSGRTAPFAELAQNAFSGAEGMSFFMLGNDRSLLYYNGEFESFLLDKATGRTSVVKPACEPIAGHRGQWLTLCNGTSVETWSE
jgi:hypothetical protein